MHLPEATFARAALWSAWDCHPFSVDSLEVHLQKLVLAESDCCAERSAYIPFGKKHRHSRSNNYVA